MKKSYDPKAFVSADRSVASDNTCGICLEVHCDDIVGSRNCSCTFGETCIRDWRNSEQGRNRCPKCKVPFECIPSHATELVIGRLKINCHSRGCPKKLPVNEMKRHILVCSHALLRCPNQECSARIKRCKLNNHVCQHETIKCEVPFCGAEIKRKFMKKHLKVKKDFHDMCIRCQSSQQELAKAKTDLERTSFTLTTKWNRVATKYRILKRKANAVRERLAKKQKILETIMPRVQLVVGNGIRLEKDWKAPYGGGHYMKGTKFTVVRVQNSKYWARQQGNESSSLVEVLTPIHIRRGTFSIDFEQDS